MTDRDLRKMYYRLDKTRAKTTRRTRIANRRDSAPPKGNVYSVMCMKPRILGNKKGKAIEIQCATVKELRVFSTEFLQNTKHIMRCMYGY